MNSLIEKTTVFFREAAPGGTLVGARTNDNGTGSGELPAATDARDGPSEPASCGLHDERPFPPGLAPTPDFPLKSTRDVRSAISLALPQQRSTAATQNQPGRPTSTELSHGPQSSPVRPRGNSPEHADRVTRLSRTVIPGRFSTGQGARDWISNGGDPRSGRSDPARKRRQRELPEFRDLSRGVRQCEFSPASGRGHRCWGRAGLRARWLREPAERSVSGWPQPSGRTRRGKFPRSIEPPFQRLCGRHPGLR